MARRFAFLLSAAMLFCGSTALAQVQRSFVASYGLDANTASNCTLANPCRSFSAAQSVTQAGGEIVALDAAGYGAITITKSISILANPGVYAGISATTGNAVTIATPGVEVRLSGLKINGLGADVGVLMTDGASLAVENCSFSGFTVAGIQVSAQAVATVSGSLAIGNWDGLLFQQGARASVVDTRAFRNGRAGVLAFGSDATTTRVAVTGTVAAHALIGFAAYNASATGTVRMSVSSSSADHNGEMGFLAQGGVDAIAPWMSVAASKATGNGVGFFNIGAVFFSAGNNLVVDNADDVDGAVVTVGVAK